MNEKNEIILFENQGVKLEVNLKDDTVWLTQDQMAKLFGKAKSTINEHIKNIYKEEELYEDETLRKFGNSEFSDKPTNYYNLDVIISVGYRVKSKNGILFRKWATKVLKDYLLKGYTINNKRLEALEKRIEVIKIAKRLENNEAYDSNEVLKVIENYTEALDLINDYDNHILPKIKGTEDKRVITYDECRNVINNLKKNFNSDLFGKERDNGLNAILGAIYQSFDGTDLYKSVEEKSANLLYLVVKNHVFLDGNKRIGATLFIYFLNFYGILYKDGNKVIDNNTLASLTLLVAESKPNEKDTIIDLIMNFLD